MTLEEVRSQLRNTILQLAAKHGARNVRVFGSVARGEADDASDIDLLVDLEPGRTLMDLGGLLSDLRDDLGLRVDVIIADCLRQSIRNRVLQDAIPL
jgi:predicted nucleotidyltransferase